MHDQPFSRRGIESGPANARVIAMTFDSVLKNFEGLRVAVFGDIMLDEYVWGEACRVSPESPVLVIKVQNETAVPGGAANVASNVVALGAQAQIFGVIGNDQKGVGLSQSLLERGMQTAGLVVDDNRPTTRKTRIVAQNQQVLRVDREETEPISVSLSTKLAQLVEDRMSEIDILLISDYAKGVVNSSTVPRLIESSQASGTIVVANSKPSNAHLFTGADILSLNLSEAIAVSSLTNFETDLNTNGTDLRRKLGVNSLVITRGSSGLTIWDANGHIQTIPAHKVDVYDVAGAGDTTIATLALAIAAGATMKDAAQLAVIAAGIVVSKVGVATVNQEEIRRQLIP